MAIVRDVLTLRDSSQGFVKKTSTLTPQTFILAHIRINKNKIKMY